MIIVTGCGRSGTSAVARMLHESGMAVGRDLIEADQGNAEGYYEERAVVELNDHVLLAAGLTEKFACASRERVVDAAAPFVDRMRELAAEATPAWKDPRFCWTLEAWLPVFDAPPRIIVCLRNPAEVVASTLRYFGVADDEGARASAHVWRSENERLLEIIETCGLDATCVEFDELHNDPTTAAARLRKFVGRDIRMGGVRQSLRHHQAEPMDELMPLYRRVRALRN